MRQLLLLRHAKSSWDDPKLPDHARPLNARGRQSAGAMRRAMQELGLVPDVVLVSSSRRTLQTLEALGPWPSAPLVEPMDALYLAPGTSLLAVLNQVTDGMRSVMVLGHNPGLHELAMLLIGDHAAVDRTVLGRLGETFPTAGLAEFAVPGPWPDLRRGGANLTRFLTPADLPELRG